MGEEEGRKAAPLPKESRRRACDAAGSPGFHQHPPLFLITGMAVVPAGQREVLLCMARCLRGGEEGCTGAGVHASSHRDAEEAACGLAGCAWHGSPARCGVTALAGAAVQPPSLPESGVSAEALGQPSQRRQAAASSRCCGR